MSTSCTGNTSFANDGERATPESLSFFLALSADEQGESHFPIKLHKMLDEIESTGHGEIVSWNADGHSFTIRNPKMFSTTLMPLYFSKQTKYKSFQRQLNLYNFKRSSKGKDKRIYSHPLFVRDNLKLCFGIRRERRSRSKNTEKAMNRQQGSVSPVITAPFQALTTQANKEANFGSQLSRTLTTRFHSYSQNKARVEVEDSRSHVAITNISCSGPLSSDQEPTTYFTVKYDSYLPLFQPGNRSTDAFSHTIPNEINILPSDEKMNLSMDQERETILDQAYSLVPFQDFQWFDDDESIGTIDEMPASVNNKTLWSTSQTTSL